MLKMFVWWEMAKAKLQDEKGQGMVEYGLILALIAVVVVVVLQTMGTDLNTKFDAVGQKLK